MAFEISGTQTIRIARDEAVRGSGDSDTAAPAPALSIFVARHAHDRGARRAEAGLPSEAVAVTHAAPRDTRMTTDPGLAGVDGTGIIVIAIEGDALTGAVATLIGSGAWVGIVAGERVILESTARHRVARIGRARILVVAHRPAPCTGPVHAPVAHRARISIIAGAIGGIVRAPEQRVAAIDGALVHVVAVDDLAAARVAVAGVFDRTRTAIVARACPRRVRAPVDRSAIVGRTRVLIVAVGGRSDAERVRVAPVARGAQVAVVTRGVDLSRGRALGSELIADAERPAGTHVEVVSARRRSIADVVDRADRQRVLAVGHGDHGV